MDLSFITNYQVPIFNNLRLIILSKLPKLPTSPKLMTPPELPKPPKLPKLLKSPRIDQVANIAQIARAAQVAQVAIPQCGICGNCGKQLGRYNMLLSFLGFKIPRQQSPPTYLKVAHNTERKNVHLWRGYRLPSLPSTSGMGRSEPTRWP